MFHILISTFTLFLITLLNVNASSSSCVCTTVPCPVNGYNYLTSGGGGAIGKYYYVTHNGHPVVTSASITITASNLDTGTDTTSCTQDYARMLDDDGVQNCDAGHILANRLGGLGNQPINIFPQESSINRGSWEQFEGAIYDCIQGGATSASLSWKFMYESSSQTKPYQVTYSVTYIGGSCSPVSTTFNNYVTTNQVKDDTNILYVFAYSWTPGFCYTTNPSYPGCIDPQPYWTENFTVHGLWPQYDTTGYPSYCSTESFDQDVPLKIGWNTMVTYYPDVKYAETDPDYDSFWEHEWDKHGTCSGLSQYDYFQQAIQLAETFATPEILHSYINTTNALSASTLRDAFGGPTYAALQCSNTNILTGVYTCWSQSPVLQIECPPSVQSEDTCSADKLTIIHL